MKYSRLANSIGGVVPRFSEGRAPRLAIRDQPSLSKPVIPYAILYHISLFCQVYVMSLWNHSKRLSSLLELLPVQIELADNMPQGAHLQVFITPIGYGYNTPTSWVVPLSMGTTASTLNFLATEFSQFSGYFSIFHADTTGINVSVQTAEPGASGCRTAGRG